MDQVDGALGRLKMLWVAMLVSIVLYVIVGEIIELESFAQPRWLLWVLVALAIHICYVAKVMRARMVRPFEEEVRSGQVSSAAALTSEQVALLERWQGGQTISICLSEAVALFGLALRFLGGTRWEAAPFYAVAMLLLVVWMPRRPG